MFANCSISFGRMFWKEYRVHRSLWLSLLIIGAAIECLSVRFALTPYEGGGTVLAITLICPMMYALGCGALLFAGEREERTCDWLMALSAPPSAVLSAKVAFAIASTAVLQALLGIVSLLLTRENIPDSPHLFLPLGLLVLIWSLLGSLFSRRVIVSVLAMAAWWIVTVFIPFMVLNILRYRSVNATTFQQTDYFFTLMPFVIIGLNVVADFWLGWRWCRGNYFDGSTLVGIGDIALALAWPKQIRPAVKVQQIPKHAELTQSWRRTWQRLIWVERKRESLHLALLAIICALGVISAIGSAITLESYTFAPVFVGALIPFAIGILGFRDDTYRHQRKFLAQRGIPPVSIWLAKQAVWVTRLVWTLAVAFGVCLAFESWFIGAEATRMMVPIRQLATTAQWNPELAICILLIGYACGQLAAVLFQRLILAIVFGALLNVGCVIWIQIVIVLGIPSWWAIWLPMATMFAITLWQMHGWMMEDQTWGRRLRLAAVLTFIPVGLLAAVVCYRVTEVMTSLPPVDGSLARMWMKAVATQESVIAKGDNGLVNRISAWNPNEADESEKSIDEIVQLTQQLSDDGTKSFIAGHGSHSGSLSRWPSEDVISYTNLSKLQSALSRRANKQIAAGELRKAADTLLVHLKLSRIFANLQSLPLWKIGTDQQRAALESIVKLAFHPDQTAESIQELKKQVEQELEKFPLVRDAIAAEYLESYKLWVEPSTKQFFENIDEHRVKFSDIGNRLMMGTPWERKRFELLLTRSSEMAFTQAWSLEVNLSEESHLPDYRSQMAPPISVATFRDTPWRLQTSQNRYLWMASSTLPREPLSPRFEEVAVRIYSREAMVRAFSIRMALANFRIKHGKSPDRIIELAGDVPGFQLIDPFSAQLFGYYPGFVYSQGTDGLTIRPVSATQVQIDDRIRVNIDELMDPNPQELITRAPWLAQNFYLIPAAERHSE